MAPLRDHYFPNTEPLGTGEMRVTALGTGRPFPRRAQANASWLVELGNGDKFMFDFGYGSQANFTALELPYQDVTAYFATHLHTDHVGDFALLWVGSWTAGRMKPLLVYGPSGTKPQYGIKHFVERQVEAYAWDRDTRIGYIPAVGAEVDVHEFDYATPQIVYEHNGVTIKAFPAVHIYDGPVSYRLEWNGLSFVYSGDTTPSKIFVEHAANADIVIHDVFNTVEQLMERSGYNERQARGVGTFVHSDPGEAGYALAQIKPRLAVAFHFYNDFDTAFEIERGLRIHYQGRLALATDLMVFNVTKDDIAVRMAVAAEHVWPNKERHDAMHQGERGQKLEMSRWLLDQQLFPKS